MKYLVFIFFILSIACASDASSKVESQESDKEAVDRLPSRVSDQISKDIQSFSKFMPKLN